MLWQTQQTDSNKIGLIFLLLLIGVPVVLASCSENQIDINSASLTKLDELYGIGPVKAQSIVDARPFDSIDDLIDVSGIGEVTLQNIKNQGLACVDTLRSESRDEIEEIVEAPEIVQEKPNTPELINPNIHSNDVQENVEAPVIKLNAQTIKSENAEKVLDKGKYSLYGFVGFCVLLIVLFIIKARKNKDEFRD